MQIQKFPSRPTRALGTALLCAGLASATPSLAADFTIESGQTVTTTQDLDTDGDTGRIEEGGVLATTLLSIDGDADNLSVLNSGTISSTLGTGIDIVGDGTNIVNNGSIQGFAQGMSLFGSGASILNDGSIGATNGSGILAFTLSDSTLVNNGVISSDGAGVPAVGLGFNNQVINTGTIASVTDGLIIDSGSVVNSGTIIAENAITHGSTLGPLSVVNSGTIIANGGFAYNSTGLVRDSLTLLPGSRIQGAINFGPGSDELIVERGVSIIYTFDGGLINGGPELLSTNGMPFAATDSTIAVVDPTLFAVSDEVITDITDGVHNTVHSRLDRFGGSAATQTAAGIREHQVAVIPYSVSDSDPEGGEPQGGIQTWVQGFGLVRNQSGDGPSSDTDHVTGGLVLGADLQFTEDALAGLFLGASRSNVEDDYESQEEDIDGLFAGAYGRLTSGRMAFDLVLSGGITDHDRDRDVGDNLAPGGTNTAEADYDGYFIAPEVGASIDLPLLQSTTIQPGARLRYIGFFLDGYSESGSADDLEVDDRDIHQLQGRLQLAFPSNWTFGDQNALEIVPRLGIDGRFMLDGDDVNATLLSQDIVFDPGGEDETIGGFLGVDANLRYSEFLSFQAGLETQFESNAYQAMGYLGARLSF